VHKRIDKAEPSVMATMFVKTSRCYSLRMLCILGLPIGTGRVRTFQPPPPPPMPKYSLKTIKVPTNDAIKLPRKLAKRAKLTETSKNTYTLPINHTMVKSMRDVVPISGDGFREGNRWEPLL
jgi:hypothetical protein